ncbi:hypothetical protein K3U93_14995 [Mycobacterium malmoense]|uniref:Lipoprotein LppN n=1 Tax=Mycobacterium malmoense TaxID=1780 RepID=A0ABX3SQR3_MYCMA|nr:hypothetical protein [Mycobacterium malmoense]ORA80207.1 hypothetical protein BST29_17055 [Mycobacterium malmoense]QZA16031.1 hypothetical protein K3U93_14995 [Mycobacterium malmoense]UNB92842.1 hypothetical protein H5T25_14985 [Mycobacterium malmoense]
MRVRSLHALCGLAAASLLAACATVTAAAAPSPPGSRTEKWIDLQVGECVDDLPPADLSRVTVTVVNCATAHLAEVYLRAPMAVDTAIANVANRDCAAGFAPYTGEPVDGGPYSITYLIDSNQDRTGSNAAPSTVICLLQAANGQPLTGSAHR